MSRSAQPLPRYVLRKPTKSGGWRYFFNVPMWARKAGCPVGNEPLGSDYEAAVQRAETILLPAFDFHGVAAALASPRMRLSPASGPGLDIRRLSRRPALYGPPFPNPPQ